MGNGQVLNGELIYLLNRLSSDAAMILPNTELNLEEDLVDVLVLPATWVGLDESITLKSYTNSTTRLLAHVEYGGTVIGKSRAPALARFSARRPSFTNHSILKPDVIAPRVKIIASMTCTSMTSCQINRGFSLNYPSISVNFKDEMRRKMFSRRVANVGSPKKKGVDRPMQKDI
ncbi:hypothetical protein TSUD_335020 [Trifolium subterraneum]|uniref:Uncharacterized protein n=1 Tax=Trifolium subterraneum TaxID=3900 RepID=A0A2Z6PEQ2_TRISU|nr:hypothetical protein TSUD_335020 [Trifolium subterraneum]